MLRRAGVQGEVRARGQRPRRCRRGREHDGRGDRRSRRRAPRVALRRDAANPAKSTVSRLKQCFEYVAHELTHMWWGDLVTFAWWDDIWLNESFATIVGFKCAASRRPEWRLWRDFLLQAIRAFDLDALAS